MEASKKTQTERRSNGEGCFRRTTSGKYQLRKMIGRKPDGKPNIITVTGASKHACYELMKAKEASMTKGSASDYLTITLTELCRRHFDSDLNWLKPKARDRRESTINNQVHGKYPTCYKIGSLQASQVTHDDVNEHIEALLDKTSLSISSIIKTFDVINAAYKWAVRKHYLKGNPCDPICVEIRKRLLDQKKKRSTAEKIVVLSENEIAALRATALNASKKQPVLNRIGLFTLLLLYTGMRVGELLALRWADWNRKYNQLTICKTRYTCRNRKIDSGDNSFVSNEGCDKTMAGRTIELSPLASSVLEQIFLTAPHTDITDYIYLNRRLKPSVPTNFIRLLNKFYREADIRPKISGAHVLRRTFATGLHNHGVLTEDIAAYLGDTAETVQKYYISTQQRISDGDKAIHFIPYKG